MIIVRLIGGLGNQMFQYALGKHLAVIHNVPLKLDISWYETDKLRKYALYNYHINEEFATKQELELYAAKNIAEDPNLPYFRRSIVTDKFFYFDPDIFKGSGSVYLQEGYWQSEKYFLDISKLICKQLTLKSELNPADLEVLNRIENHDAIALHVRRGDYIDNPQTSHFHGSCSIDYYRAAAGLIAHKIAKPLFFVFSDDLEWVRNNLKLPYPVFYVSHNGTERDFADLYLMSRCSHQIIANSSFSWWGAWLNPNPGKIIVAPERWLNTHEYDTRDLLPESWTRLSETIAKQFVKYDIT